MSTLVQRNPYTRILENDPFDSSNNILYYQNIASCLSDVAESYNHPHGEDIFMGYSALSEQTQALSDMYAELYHSDEEVKELKQMIHTEFSAVLVDLQQYAQAFPGETVSRDLEFGSIFLQAFTV